LSGANQAETLLRAMAIKIDGEMLFDTVQATFNLMEPSIGPTLYQAHQQGMGVIIKEAVANGRLTSANHRPEDAKKRALLDDEAERLGTTIDALALAAILAQPWVDVVLSGAATVEHLRSNVLAFEVPWSEAVAERLVQLAESPEVYWQTRSGLAWN
ncbi:MAG: aldo/keto reductase, partial [Chloroflexi bacterium]|nr:aldo/keto reductase [Chloroflexota bacterium]